MARDFGVTTLGSVEPLDFFLTTRPARQIDITVASGQGVLASGTPMQKNSETGNYEKYTSGTFAGVLYEEVDATDEDVNTYLLFDCDINRAVLVAAGVTTLPVAYYPDSAINLKEAN